MKSGITESGGSHSAVFNGNPPHRMPFFPGTLDAVFRGLLICRVHISPSSTLLFAELHSGGDLLKGAEAVHLAM